MVSVPAELSRLKVSRNLNFAMGRSPRYHCSTATSRVTEPYWPCFLAHSTDISAFATVRTSRDFAKGRTYVLYYGSLSRVRFRATMIGALYLTGFLSWWSLLSSRVVAWSACPAWCPPHAPGLGNPDHKDARRSRSETQASPS